MSAPAPDICRRFATLQSDPDAVVAALADQLDRDAQLTVVFVSPRYDLAALGPRLRELSSGDVIACTTAGEIGANGFQHGGLVAMSLKSPLIHAETWSFDVASGADVGRVAAAVDRQLLAMPSDQQAAGILLIDGLSRHEEHAVAALYAHLGELPIVGGSAGDDLAFASTAVLDGDTFRSGRATLTLLRTSLPLTAFKFQHHAATAKRLVVTAANPDARMIMELDGYPAAEGYAAVLGVDVAELRRRPELIARHPLMLRVGPEHFVRSVRTIDAHGHLQLYCAIDRGAVLTIGETRDMVPGLRDRLEALHRRGPIAALLTFDCVLRRLEMEEAGVDETVGGLLSAAGAVGFSTYGEQFAALHVNQTLVGLALGMPEHG
jgi:hypothetical protein